MKYFTVLVVTAKEPCKHVLMRIAIKLIFLVQEFVNYCAMVCYLRKKLFAQNQRALRCKGFNRKVSISIIKQLHQLEKQLRVSSLITYIHLESAERNEINHLQLKNSQ